MARGGKRPGAGRKPNSKNKLTAERDAAMKEAAVKINAAIPDAFKGDAHALLMAIYKDPAHSVELRRDAAKAALAFEKPRLQAIVPEGSRDAERVPLHERLKAYTRDDAIEASAGKVVELPKKSKPAAPRARTGKSAR